MPDTPLKILHVMRAPVGGLFRHVLDLVQGQAARGHRVGIVVAQPAANSPAEAKLAAIAPKLALDLHRIVMRRAVGMSDVSAIPQLRSIVANTTPDVVHGHGAKGGAYARLAGASGICVYTPHGGSLHYGAHSLQGRFYAAAERLLARRTDLCLFESEFARATYQDVVGKPDCLVRVVHNGVGPGEFETVAPLAGATDLLSIGELRYLKGIDVIIEATSELGKYGRRPTLTIVGDGPDADSLRALVAERGLTDTIRFAGFTPARDAFAMGRILVVASRAESLPYIVLEAAAAGVPMIATRVGGIPEIFASSEALLPPGDAGALASAIMGALDHPATITDAAQRLRERVQTHFSQEAMVDGILAAYAEAIRFKFHRSH